MNEIFDIYTLLFLVIAVVVILRLRSVLGRRTGHERPPFDPYSADEGGELKGPNGAAPAGNDTVVPLPSRGERAGAGEEAIARDWSRFAKPGSALAKTFDTAADIDPRFDPASFLEGAKAAYEMIVTAFAASDRKGLQPLLGREVLDGFMQALDERDKRGEQVDTTFISIDRAGIVDGSVRGVTAQLAVRFVSQMISVTRNKDGAIIDGDPSEIRKVTDVWTFARELDSNNPNWRLVATEAAE